MQRLIKILQSHSLQSWTLSPPFYINHEIRCLPASYLFRLVINVQKKGTSLQYKIITHNYIHNSSLWQIPSFLFLLSFAFLLASFDFSYLDDIINCWSYGENKESQGAQRGLFLYGYTTAAHSRRVLIHKHCLDNIQGITNCPANVAETPASTVLDADNAAPHAAPFVGPAPEKSQVGETRRCLGFW